MTSIRRRSKAQPGLVGWLFATGSFLFALALGVFGVASRFEHDANRSLDQLSSSLSAGAFTEARHILESWPPAPYLSSVVDSSAVAMREHLMGIARDLATLGEQATAKTPVSISGALERAHRGMLSLPETYVDSLNDWDRIRVLLEEQNSDIERLEDIAAIREETTASLATLAQQYDKLRIRFAALVGLRRDSLRPLDTGLPTYARGVFAGLPVLHRIPDGLVSLVEVKSALDQIGGQVAMTGPTAADDFTAEVETLRALMGPITQQRDGHMQLTSDLREEEQDLLRQREQRSPRLGALLTPIIVRLTPPPPSWSARLFKSLKGA